MLTAARAINPSIVQNDLLRGMILDGVGRYAEAITVLDSVVASGRAPLDGHYRLALAYYHAGELEQARQAMESAVGVAGGNLNEPTTWLARIHWERGDPAAARRTLGAFLALRPEDSQVRAILERLSLGDDSLLPR